VTSIRGGVPVIASATRQQIRSIGRSTGGVLGVLHADEPHPHEQLAVRTVVDAVNAGGSRHRS